MKLVKFFFALAFSSALSTTASANDALEQYTAKLQKHTAKHVEYPKRAQQRNWQGLVKLRVTIDAQGQVQNIQVLEESNYSSLNRAALRSVERANPYPAIPGELGLESYEFIVPINFKLSS